MRRLDVLAMACTCLRGLLLALLCAGVIVCTLAVRAVLLKVSSAADEALAIERRINGQNGTIAEVDKLLLAARSTTVHVDIAARHEDRQLGKLDEQETQLFRDLHGVALRAGRDEEALGGTLEALRGNLDAMQPIEKDAHAAMAQVPAVERAAELTLDRSSQVASELHRVLSDPEIHATAAQLSSASASAAGILADGKKVADRFSSPPKKHWYQKILTALETSGKIAFDVITLGGM